MPKGTWGRLVHPGLVDTLRKTQTGYPMRNRLIFLYHLSGEYDVTQEDRSGIIKVGV